MDLNARTPRDSTLPERSMLPEFDPSDAEYAQLISDLRISNDDHGDKSGPLDADDMEALVKHPRVHVALSIMRTGAVSLVEDNDDDPNHNYKSVVA
jgi:hypothetical protein